MVEDARIAVEAVFDAFGEDAVAYPGGVARMIRVIRVSPDRDEFAGLIETRSRSVVLEVRASDANGLGDGTLIELGGERRVIQGEVEARDPLRLTRHLDTAPAPESLT